MKAAVLAILALVLGGCTARSLTTEQMAGIAEVEVSVGAAQAIPFVKASPSADPAKRQPIDTSKGVGHVASELVSNAWADTSAAVADDQRRQAVSSRFSSFVRAMGTYDFAPDMLAATKNELAKVTTIKLEVRPPPLDLRAAALRRSIYEQSRASAVLFFFVEYSFRELYGVDYVLAFDATAVILPRSDDLKKLRRRPDDADPLADGNAIYRRHFADSIKYRAGDDVPAMFRQAAQRLASALAQDLNKAK